RRITPETRSIQATNPRWGVNESLAYVQLAHFPLPPRQLARFTAGRFGTLLAGKVVGFFPFYVFSRTGKEWKTCGLFRAVFDTFGTIAASIIKDRRPRELRRCSIRCTKPVGPSSTRYRAGPIR